MAAGLVALGLALAARGLLRHNTWYLASDQFAFLTFADDLAAGHVFHDPAAVASLVSPRIPRTAAVDAYYQTYVYRDGLLFSRYPPGFPLLLAAAKRLGGDAAMHWLNPALYLLLLALLAAIAARLVEPELRWPTAATTVWLMLVLPAEVHYWGITVSRDLPAHLLALAGLLLAARRSSAWAGLSLGFATSIRPDAALWLPALQLACPLDARSPRSAIATSAGFLVGAAPLLAYNTITGGNPFAFTQGGEFRDLFNRASMLPLPAFAMAWNFTSGGAFRFANLTTTLPAHLAYLAGALGGFVVLAGVGLRLAASRSLARGLGLYALVGLLFYSCWAHGDPRYLVGVVLCLILLAGAGVTTSVARLAGGDMPPARRWAVVALVGLVCVAARWVGARDPGRGLSVVEAIVAAAFAAAASWRWRASTATTLPLLGLLGFGLLRLAAGAGSVSDAFRADDVERARVAVTAAIPPGALLLTSPALGRPAENIAHYAGRDATYLGELPRLGADAAQVAARAERDGRPLFLLLGATEAIPDVGKPRQLRQIAHLAGTELRTWFVDVGRAPAGAVLYAVDYAVRAAP